MLFLTDLTQYLNNLLSVELIKDYCPNGLQVDGKPKVKKIVTGVTANQALIEQAIKHNADAVLVHHGYFWKNESATITGMKYRRIKALLSHDISLLAYHLPLDVHEEFGNNKQLAKQLEFTQVTALDNFAPPGIVMCNKFEQPISAEHLQARINANLNRNCLFISGGKHAIHSVAWCTGGGQDYIEAVAEQGIDAFISGEISERTTHIARELGIHYFAAGHHATERYGIKALGEHLAEQFNIDVQFIDIDNPV